METQSDKEYQLKIEQRHKNYVEYYEKIKPSKRYKLQELMDMTEMELLALMPNNQTVSEHSEQLGFDTLKYIVGFQMNKIIDGSWNIGYYDGNGNTLLKEQYTLFEITYVKNLKIGLIDLFLMFQNRQVENFNGIKSGRIKLMLDDNWDDRKELGLK